MKAPVDGDMTTFNLLQINKDNSDICYSLMCIINSVTCRQFPAGCSEKHLSSSAEPVTNPNLYHNNPHPRLKLQLMHKIGKNNLEIRQVWAFLPSGRHSEVLERQN